MRVDSPQLRRVAVLIFDDVEVLDFAGPFEVFSVAGEAENIRHFEVYTVAEAHEPICTRGGMSVNPAYTITTCPTPDVIVVPGGVGSRQAMLRQPILDWVQHHARKPALTLSVCTGALILAKAGLLEGLTATTHFSVLDYLRKLAPNTVVVDDQRFVDNGNIVTAAGISAGIDMSLHIVSRLLGREIAQSTAKEMEYAWQAA
ncbi:MAG: DJ-1/PfpI family protein [Anaerolineae bacterium]